MKKKLKLWGISNQDSGVQLYRINQPLRFIGDQNLAHIHTLPFFGQHADHLTTPEFTEYFALEGTWADVLMTTCASGKDYLALVLSMKYEGKMKLVVDLDDDILATHTEPTSPAYLAHLNSQSRHAEYAQACLREADLVTVSTEYLKKKYATLNDNIVVVKNCIDPKFFSHPSTPDDLTIGYAGSGSHQADWLMLEPLLNKLKQTQSFKVKVLGPMQTKGVDEQINWIDTLKYPETLAGMGFSIGIAPLKDSLMNRAKSNLRWLEYSAFKIPTIASDVVPFREMEHIIRVSEPEEWVEAIMKLGSDQEYRRSLGEKAYNELITNYDPNYWSRILHTAIANLF